MVFKAHHDTIEYRTIHDKKLPKVFENFTVFFISDIHRRNVKLQTLKSIRKPIDMIAIGGDLTEKKVPLERTRNNIRTLKKLSDSIYFVWGNHDYEVPYHSLYNMLIEEGVDILQDTYRMIRRKNVAIHLFGFDYHQFNEDRGDMSWLKNMDVHYSILLTHVPDSFYELDPEVQNKFHTVLAGHTHGGQIRLFGFGYYQKGGLSIYQHTNVLISEGYGYTLLPFRLQTKSECHVLTFKSKKTYHK